MKLQRKRWLSESVRSVRWIVVLGMIVIVAVYQILTEFVFDLSSTERMVFGILIYAGIGSLYLWIALTWFSNQIAAGERAERKAKEGEKFISSIVSESADAILSTTVEGVVTSWNKGAEFIFGYTKEEMIGQHFSELVPPDLLLSGELERLTSEMHKRGYVRNAETQRLTKDGRRIFVEVTRTTLTDDDGKPWRNSAIVRDITERKNAERQLQASYEKIVEAEREIRKMNQQLEEKIAWRTENLRQAYQELEKANKELRKANEQLKELDRMKSEFVSMVSHALRAPVTNINGAIELLSQSDSSFESDEGEELFEIIKAESARLTRLVQDVLTVSRLEGGRIELGPELTDMQVLSSKIVHNLSAIAENHTISLACPHDLPNAWADRDCTEEILVNLLDNAIKYSPDGGHIEVRLAEQEGYIIVSVVDEGIGVRARDIDKIFEMFHRSDGSDNVAIEGYGLGLYTAKRLVEAQGGTIEVKSTLGRGSIFSFSLPKMKKREQDSSDKS
ncbi:MAG: PAS domain-containing sensor histidine kinase [Dehalococcoidia bacterium]